MGANSNERHDTSPRWGYLLLATLVLFLTGVILGGLWYLPELIPQLAERPAVLHPATPSPATHAPPPATPPRAITSPPPTATLTPTPTITHPATIEVAAEVDERAKTVTFHGAAEVPPDRHIDEVLLWYDTEVGHQLQRLAGPLPPSVTLSHRLDVLQEGLTMTLTAGELWSGTLDYWWQVRDTSGESVRAGGTVVLGPTLQSLVTTPTPGPPHIDFTWTVSESRHFLFHVVPDTAAERDLTRIGPLAEAALERINTRLGLEFDGQMHIYLVPRLFWQGAAAYAEKIQLISYLDRNYTGIETWSYFTHEGTHALAQDLLQPKEDHAGPDGVLVEGLAVWASGGHYRQEPLDIWAAVTADSEDYIPLAELRAGPFYDFQHEISYLEAASFVKFLVERYGWDKLKELYGLATGDATHDEELVQHLYGRSYAELEAAWLDHLDGLEPKREEAETWRLTIRSFDLMRRYETELDPDARLLPSAPPPEWMTDTLEVFLSRRETTESVALETVLIAAQERLYSGNLEGAAALLDDAEAALDADTSGDMLNRPSLQARKAIMDLVAAQDRAILRADAAGYLQTVEPASALSRRSVMESLLDPPFVSFHQEVVRLDIADDGRSAQGAVLVHAQLAEGETTAGRGALAEDGQLYAVAFAKVAGCWLMTDRRSTEPLLTMLPPTLEAAAH